MNASAEADGLLRSRAGMAVSWEVVASVDKSFGQTYFGPARTRPGPDQVSDFEGGHSEPKPSSHPNEIHGPTRMPALGLADLRERPKIISARMDLHCDTAVTPIRYEA